MLPGQHFPKSGHALLKTHRVCYGCTRSCSQCGNRLLLERFQGDDAICKRCREFKEIAKKNVFVRFPQLLQQETQFKPEKMQQILHEEESEGHALRRRLADHKQKQLQLEAAQKDERRFEGFKNKTRPTTVPTAWK